MGESLLIYTKHNCCSIYIEYDQWEQNEGVLSLYLNHVFNSAFAITRMTVLILTISRYFWNKPTSMVITRIKHPNRHLSWSRCQARYPNCSAFSPSPGSDHHHSRRHWSRFGTVWRLKSYSPGTRQRHLPDSGEHPRRCSSWSNPTCCNCFGDTQKWSALWCGHRCSTDTHHTNRAERHNCPTSSYNQRTAWWKKLWEGVWDVS